MTASAEIAIGELSRRTQCNIETIRYYERIGLLPQPRRTSGGFRCYDGDDVARLRFIRRARQLGFTLDEVRAFMRLAGTAGDDEVCAQARSLAAAHVGDIRAKIADLRAMERVLSHAIRDCESGRQPRCPLIEVLSREGDWVSIDINRPKGRKRPSLPSPPSEARQRSAPAK